jgi:hypothetical protein
MQIVWRCVSVIAMVDIGTCMRLNVQVADRTRKDKAGLGYAAVHGFHSKAHDREFSRKAHGNLTLSDHRSIRTLLSHSSFDAFTRFQADLKSTGKLIDERSRSWVVAGSVGLLLVCCCACIGANAAVLESDRDAVDSDCSSFVSQGSIGKRVRSKTRLLSNYNGDDSAPSRITLGISKLLGRNKERPVRLSKSKPKARPASKCVSSDQADGEHESSSESENEPALQPSYDDDSTPRSARPKNRVEKFLR